MKTSNSGSATSKIEQILKEFDDYQAKIKKKKNSKNLLSKVEQTLNAYVDAEIKETRAASRSLDRKKTWFEKTLKEKLKDPEWARLYRAEGAKIRAKDAEMEKKRTESFNRACRDAGITRKGKRLAAAVWQASEAVFAEVPPHQARAAAEIAAVLFRIRAADIEKKASHV